MRSIFCGNLDFVARQYDVERLFKRNGKVDRVDMKSDLGSRKGGDSRKPAANMKPSKTLFVINFDPVHTRTRDIERHFDAYGKIANIRIRKNFAFVQYENQEHATRALEATNMRLLERVITVEYAIRDDDDDRRNGHSPGRRDRNLSPDGKGYGRRRSPGPHSRRGTTDSGRESNPSSLPEARVSPKYDRTESTMNVRKYDRNLSPDGRGYGGGRSPGPHCRRGITDYCRESNPSSKSEVRVSPEYGGSESPINSRRYDSRLPQPRGRS